nr:unnamed protein product [Callosobruchus analis]
MNGPEEEFCKVKSLGQNRSDEFVGSDTDRGYTSYDSPSNGVENTHNEILEESSFSPRREIQNRDNSLLSDEDPFETDDDSVADIDYSTSEESSKTTSDENMTAIDQEDLESDDLDTHSSGETDTWGPLYLGNKTLYSKLHNTRTMIKQPSKNLLMPTNCL